MRLVVGELNKPLEVFPDHGGQGEQRVFPEHGG
jgi:hypothetical protein